MGSIVGAIAGAAIGSVVPGVGTSLGATIGGGIGGALSASSDQKKAVSAQVGALQQGESTTAATLANELQLQHQALLDEQTQYNNNVATQTPYVQAGNAALNEYSNLLMPGTTINGTTITNPSGVIPTGGTPTTVATAPATGAGTNGETTTAASGSPITGNQGSNQLAALANTPGYQFELQQGMLALEHGAAATTGVLSSAESQALINYGQGLAGTTYNSFMDRLAGLASSGQTAATNEASMGQSNTNAQAGILQSAANDYGTAGANTAQLEANIGAAKAAGYNAAAASNNSIANGLLSQALPQLFGTSSSPSSSAPSTTNSGSLYTPAGQSYQSIVNPTLSSTAGGSFTPVQTGVNLAGGNLGGLALSDERIKRNIKYVGKGNGQNLYKFNYAGEKKKYIGVIAQDVEKKRPDAVKKGPGGLKMVDYKKLGLKMQEA